MQTKSRIVCFFLVSMSARLKRQYMSKGATSSPFHVVAKKNSRCLHCPRQNHRHRALGCRCTSLVHELAGVYWSSLKNRKKMSKCILYKKKHIGFLDRLAFIDPAWNRKWKSKIRLCEKRKLSLCDRTAICWLRSLCLVTTQMLVSFCRLQYLFTRSAVGTRVVGIRWFTAYNMQSYQSMRLDFSSQVVKKKKDARRRSLRGSNEPWSRK